MAVLDHDVTYPFLALEFCNGGDLTHRLQKPYDRSQILRWGHDIATALEAAHGLQPDPLIHWDLKPDNILIADGQLKISDFGTSQMLQDSQSLRSLKGGFTPDLNPAASPSRTQAILTDRKLWNQASKPE